VKRGLGLGGLPALYDGALSIEFAKELYEHRETMSCFETYLLTGRHSELWRFAGKYTGFMSR
jgi:hypothetical protein